MEPVHHGSGIEDGVAGLRAGPCDEQRAHQHGAIQVGVAPGRVAGGCQVRRANSDLGPVERAFVRGAALGDIQDEVEIGGLALALLAFRQVSLQPDRPLLDELANGNQRIALLDRIPRVDRLDLLGRIGLLGRAILLGASLQCLTSAAPPGAK